MQIVIDLPEYTLASARSGSTSFEQMDIILESIRNGVPLPKGHGRLRILSEDVIKREQTSLGIFCQNWISEVGLSNATVAIIEADGGAE